MSVRVTVGSTATTRPDQPPRINMAKERIPPGSFRLRVFIAGLPSILKGVGPSFRFRMFIFSSVTRQSVAAGTVHSRAVRRARAAAPESRADVDDHRESRRIH